MSHSGQDMEKTQHTIYAPIISKSIIRPVGQSFSFHEHEGGGEEGRRGGRGGGSKGKKKKATDRIRNRSRFTETALQKEHRLAAFFLSSRKILRCALVGPSSESSSVRFTELPNLNFSTTNQPLSPSFSLGGRIFPSSPLSDISNISHPIIQSHSYYKRLDP